VKNPVCPLLRKPCIENGCKFWIHVVGKHPSTGAAIDNFDCSFTWLPVLLIDTALHTAGVQASVESMRNAVVQRQDQLNNAVALGQRETAKRIGEQEWSNQERLPKTT
jgi:hypothetical protein